MNIDGSAKKKICIAGGSRFSIFSPDGSRVLIEKGNDLFLSSMEGTLTNITSSAASEWKSDFFPNGSQIAAQSNKDGNFEVYIINADGSYAGRLTNNAAYDGFPSVSNDGSKIAFQSSRLGGYEIFIMKSDGGNQTYLTNESTHSNLEPSF